MSFQLVPARQLPSVDLSRSVLSLIAPAEARASIVQWTQRHAQKLAWCNRLGISGIIVGFFTPRAVGAPVMVVCSACCVVGATPTVLLSNVPLLLLLLRQYEFWVFSLFNAINWSLCAVLFGDVRAVSCFACWLNTTLIICIDANTRTLMNLVRGATMWLPGVVAITVLCMLHLFDIDLRQYEPLVLWQHDEGSSRSRSSVSLTLVNLFANVSITISVYVGIRLYFKRAVLTPRFRQRRMIPSSIFRVGLALEAHTVEVKPEAEGIMPTPPRPTHPVQSFKRLLSSKPWRSAVVFNEAAYSTNATESRASTHATSVTADDIQQMQPIRPRVTSFSSDDTLVRGLTGPGSAFGRFLLAVGGSTGLAASTYGLAMQIHADVASILGLALTVAFGCVILANCNRHVLWSLAKNFDALYLSFQTCASAVSIDLSLQTRGARGISVAALLLWLHLTMVLDALLPDARRRLGLKKRHFISPLLVVVVLHALLLHSTLTGSPIAAPCLENRVIFCLRGDEFCIYTLSFLLMRLVSLLIVLLRLLWTLVTQRDSELLFFRGRVEFYVPARHLPFELAAATTSGIQVATVVLPDSGQQERRSGDR